MTEIGKDRLAFPNHIIAYSGILELQYTIDAKFLVGLTQISALL